jgi:hypothetical protein
MRKYSYSKQEMKYILSFITQETYDEVCSRDKYLVDGRLITPMLDAQIRQKTKEKMKVLRNQSTETSIKTSSQIG